MTFRNVRDVTVLAIGDLLVLLISLWLTLLIRYGRLPDAVILDKHLIPFSVLFVIWMIVFYIAGMYERPILALKVNVSSFIFRTHLVNSALALAFFYFIPLFAISPKINLIIFLFVSLSALISWRTLSYRLLRSAESTPAFLIAGGEEMRHLRDEINNDARKRAHFVSFIDPDKMEGVDVKEDVVGKIYSEEIKVVVVDLHHENVEKLLPSLYNLIFSNVRFVDMRRLYEEVFERVPFSTLRYNWFLENISNRSRVSYDLPKRIIDISVALVGGLISLVFYPFVILALKFEDGGEIFSIQTRVGKNNRPIKLFKFRTMTLANDDAHWGETKNEVTKVGKFLRKSRIDELPQLWNVLMGGISLIGPRPEFSDPVKKYCEEIPYYNIRHIIKPGLSGWAQIKHENHPHHSIDVIETKRKLSYDLYYIKNRSLFLDIKVVLKTITHLLLNKGK